MHIKTGTWENSNAVCESDSLCDPAVLVSTTNTEPHIRNRRLSPGSGNCGGGGGGGCIVGVEQPPHQPSPRDLGGHLNGPSHGHAFAFRKIKERRGPHKSPAHPAHTLRREGQKAAPRLADRPQKQKWAEDSLSLLKPPPAFPVQDSPAKLQPAVSYASKVKVGASPPLEEDRPAIGMLLQNQWGLSFISEASPAAEPLGPCPTSQPTDPEEEMSCTGPSRGDPATPVAAPVAFGHCPTDESNSKLLLTTRHLVEALNYHSREWKAVCNKHKDSKKIIWYRDTVEQPA